METRTDTHRLATINPNDYGCVTDFYQGGSEQEAHEMRHPNRNHAAASDLHPSFDGHFTATGRCDMCGTMFAWGVCYLHRPSGELVRVGHQCAGEYMGLPDRIAVERKRASKTAATKRAAIKARTEAAAILAADPVWAAALATDHYIVDSIRAQFMARGGRISDKQIVLVHRLAAEEAAAPAKVQEATAPVPITSDRVRVTGEVVSVKSRENYYDGTTEWKMVVRDDRGFKVWGSLPAKIRDAERGDRVGFDASVCPSGDDETFGFFKRPTKPEILAAG